jgi:hypothetical protein
MCQVPRFTSAHRARCAAASFLLVAADTMRLGFGARCFAQRAFCAMLIRRRAAAAIVCWRVLMVWMLARAANAASRRWASLCARSRSAFNCAMTAEMFAIATPSEMIAGT